MGEGNTCQLFANRPGLVILQGHPQSFSLALKRGLLQNALTSGT